MVEIMVGIWCCSFIMSMIVLFFNLRMTSKRLKSEKLKILNLNLAKAGMYWSNALGSFAELKPDAVEEDRRKAIRNSAMIGLLGLFSLIGFILLTLVVFSIHFLARSRKEIATFRSALAEDPALTKPQVEALLVELKDIY